MSVSESYRSLKKCKRWQGRAAYPAWTQHQTAYTSSGYVYTPRSVICIPRCRNEKKRLFFFNHTYKATEKMV